MKPQVCSSFYFEMFCFIAKKKIKMAKRKVPVPSSPQVHCLQTNLYFKKKTTKSSSASCHSAHVLRVLHAQRYCAALEGQ